MAVPGEQPLAQWGWLLARLDAFLSEPLRRAPPSELARCRLMTGASLFLLFGSVLYLLSGPTPPTRLCTLVSALGYLGTLLLLRNSSSPTAPAWMLCGVLTQALVVSVFVNEATLSGAHASVMLLPALGVYLMGLRSGLILTTVLIVSLGLLHPLHHTSSHPGPVLISEERFWALHVTAAFSFVGAWGLSTLHSTARSAAEASLERTLRQLRGSESRLSSLFEGTGDAICSLDLQGHLIAANSAMRRSFLERYGQEPRVGQNLLASAPPERQELWRQRFAQVSSTQPLRFEEEYVSEGRRLMVEARLSSISGEDGQITGVTLSFRDITDHKETEARLDDLHHTLENVSRQAGMAELATGVLHNVGNTLNSVNVSTQLLGELLRHSRVTRLAKATRLLHERSAELGTFLTIDPQGQKLAAYLFALSEHLVEEHAVMSKEVLALGESVDHIKSVIGMQQQHARTAGATEQLQVPQLIDEALRLHAFSLERMSIHIERDYAHVPPILADRHRLLQILINLLSNARHALMESEQQDKRLIIRALPSADGQRLRIEVADNGHGIAPEHLPRMFTQGFTTRKTGHGFGLHISALAASEMRGRLSCTSPGPGQGATFILDLPLVGEEASS
ncbi:MAG: PAS domain S-box protein [Myxococcaceae bacterium]|nr:PAS domain S-box protein [Myxococcaceae bacterium]